jgi:hypothetical protein
MVDAVVFWKALVVGLSIAAPVGPIGLLTIQRTMVAGVFVGSASWWLFLATVVAATRTRFGDAWRHRVNTGSALVLVVFAVWQVVGAVGVRL